MTEKLEKIYEVMADKTLSFGCKCFYRTDETEKEFLGKIWKRFENWVICFTNYPYLQTNVWHDEKCITKIIGHSVMIGDVLDYLEKNEVNYPSKQSYAQNYAWVMENWKDKTKSIEFQNQDCQDFVYSLIPKE